MLHISAADQSYPSRRELKNIALDHVLNNPEGYDDVDYESLGLALYTEQSFTDETIDISEVKQYIIEAEDFDAQEFISYKIELAEDYDEVIEVVGQVFESYDELIQEAEAHGILYQGLFEEASSERDNAERAINQILQQASDVDLDFDEPDDLFTVRNVNWGNQVLSEQPPGNLNLGNQVVIKDHRNWSSGGSQPNSDDLYEEWRNDENWETDF